MISGESIQPERPVAVEKSGEYAAVKIAKTISLIYLRTPVAKKNQATHHHSVLR